MLVEDTSWGACVSTSSCLRLVAPCSVVDLLKSLGSMPLQINGCWMWEIQLAEGTRWIYQAEFLSASAPIHGRVLSDSSKEKTNRNTETKHKHG